MDPALELALEMPRLPQHPEDHPGEESGRKEHRHALEDLLGRAGELRVDRIQDGEETEAHRGRRAEAEPDPAVRAFRADLGEVGEDDPGDERHLDALAEGDDQSPEVARRHGGCSLMRYSARRIVRSNGLADRC